MTDNIIPLFTYGTLMKGHRNYPLYLDGLNSTRDNIKGELYNLGRYPIVIQGEENVPGEVFMVDPITFYEIAQMETGVGYTIAKTKTNLGKTVWCFIGDYDYDEYIRKIIARSEKIPAWSLDLENY